jgi:hypothetical protein
MKFAKIWAYYPSFGLYWKQMHFQKKIHE